MKAYFTKTPKLIQNFFKNYSWKIANNKKEIFLTFDDGPHPEITPWVLNLLKKYKAKATFFCVGENVDRYPEIFKELIKQDHSIGNHTFNHLNGWKTNTSNYLDNIEKTEETIKKLKFKIHPDSYQDSKLFRPPYGKIKPRQTRALLEQDYQIIMWDVLSGDFDHKLSKDQCLKNTIKYTQNGSIVVFHDSEKAFKNLEHVLPEFLKYFSKKGFEFCGL